MVEVAIVGASGYAGAELVRLAEAHSEVSSIAAMSGRADAQPVAFEPLGARTIEPLDLGLLPKLDVVFVCLPHGVGHAITHAALGGGKGARVVDLSSDHRFKDAALYEQVYGIEHPSPELCDSAAYGLTELEHSAIVGARLVANPGCYPTASLLGLLPLVRAGVVKPGSRVVIDAKSGVSGAGKSPSGTTLYGNVNESCRAYGVGTHRHAPEIRTQLDAELHVTFVPHLLPMFRGMLATIYVDPAPNKTVRHAEAALQEAYADSPFVHVIDGQPETGDVARTNHCHLSVTAAHGGLVITSAIDNLVKGAAGAALQNMNVMLGFEETDGLRAQPGGVR